MYPIENEIEIEKMENFCSFSVAPIIIQFAHCNHRRKITDQLMMIIVLILQQIIKLQITVFVRCDVQVIETEENIR